MWKIFLLLLSCAFLDYGAVTGDELALPEKRLFGGTQANPGQFKYMASIQYTGYGLTVHLCGGTIISRKTILTAAHCLVQRKTSNLSAVLGATALYTTGMRYAVDSFLIHPDYDIIANSPINNVGLLYLVDYIEYTTLVASIELDPGFVGAGLNTTIQGWGSISSADYVKPSENLKFLHTLTMSQENCTTRLIVPLLSSQMCTLYTNTQGACYGDSGSPLVRNGKQIAIFSWMTPCARQLPDVYEKISNHVDWINANTSAAKKLLISQYIVAFGIVASMIHKHIFCL